MKIYLAENLLNSYYINILSHCSAKNILFSYAYALDEPKERLFANLDKLNADNIIIDSGAFTAWTQNQLINLKKYAEFCKMFINRKENIYIINLDVIPGEFGRKPTKEEIDQSAKKGWKNILEMEEAGLKVIHVFHQHEDFKWLNKLVEHQEYIGISPANDVSKKQRIQWLDQVFSKIKNTRKTHGFGVTAREIIYRYPWYSVDSSSWKAICRFGCSCTTNLKKRGLGHQPGIFMKKELVPEIKRWQKLEKEATQLWASRGVIWNN